MSSCAGSSPGSLYQVSRLVLLKVFTTGTWVGISSGPFLHTVSAFSPLLLPSLSTNAIKIKAERPNQSLKKENTCLSFVALCEKKTNSARRGCTSLLVHKQITNAKSCRGTSLIIYVQTVSWISCKILNECSSFYSLPRTAAPNISKRL